jgi:hypothetical protein
MIGLLSDDKYMIEHLGDRLKNSTSGPSLTSIGEYLLKLFSQHPD